MNMTRTLVAALACTVALTTPAFAGGKNVEIAPEAGADAAAAPANYDPALKAANEKGLEGIVMPEANPIVVLDPGHGGSDSGAVGYGLYEKNLTLDIATRAKNYMATNFPSTVYMTRTTDATVELSTRTSFANSKGANFFVSFHINSYSTSSPNGLETYYYTGSTNGQRLATKLYDQLRASYSTLRGVKDAAFYVLKYTNMPASLGETGFISNATDAGNLGNATFRQNLAVQYVKGMYNYWWGL